MLERADDLCGIEPVQVAHHEVCGCFGIVRESARPDDDVFGVGVHVGDRGEVDVETVFLDVAADGESRLVGFVRVAGFGDGLHTFVLGHVKVLVVRDAGHAAALFVNRKQGRTIQLSDFLDERSKLRFVHDVVRIENHTADGVILVDGSHGLVHLLQFEVRQVGVRFPVDARIERFGAHEEHLPHLLAEGHLADIENGLGIGRGVCCGCAAGTVVGTGSK